MRGLAFVDSNDKVQPIDRISGPVSFSVHENIRGRTFYIFGDRHAYQDSYSNMCLDETAFTVKGFIRLLSGHKHAQTDVFGEFSPLMVKDMTYYPRGPLPDIASLYVAKERGSVDLGTTRLHFGDARFSSKNLITLLNQCQGTLDCNQVQRRLFELNLNLHVPRDVTTFLQEILLSDKLCDISRQKLDIIGRSNTVRTSTLSGICARGCHRIRKQIQRIAATDNIFLQHYTEWVNKELGMMLIKWTTQYRLINEELSSKAESIEQGIITKMTRYTTQVSQTLFDANSFITDVYNVGRMFKIYQHAPMRNVVFYFGDLHAERIRRFLKKFATRTLVFARKPSYDTSFWYPDRCIVTNAFVNDGAAVYGGNPGQQKLHILD
jgi:hypothetical protein